MGSKQTIKIKSKIRSGLIRSSLKKGGPLAAMGALILIVGGTFFPLEILKIWGIPLFFIGILLIIVGLSPYRKLSRLQLKPNELFYDGFSYVFCREGKPLLKIPEKSIAEMHYFEREALYGAAIKLKRPIVEKVSVLDEHFNFSAFTADSLTRFDCDLFLPYFTKEDITTLIE